MDKKRPHTDSVYFLVLKEKKEEHVYMDTYIIKFINSLKQQLLLWSTPYAI